MCIVNSWRRRGNNRLPNLKSACGLLLTHDDIRKHYVVGGIHHTVTIQVATNDSLAEFKLLGDHVRVGVATLVATWDKWDMGH